MSLRLSSFSTWRGNSVSSSHVLSGCVLEDERLYADVKCF